jgi:hypothetical protein
MADSRLSDLFQREMLAAGKRPRLISDDSALGYLWSIFEVSICTVDRPNKLVEVWGIICAIHVPQLVPHVRKSA